MFLKRLLSFLRIRRDDAEVIVNDEPVWPDELWARMFAMADYARTITLANLGVRHFDIEVNVTTTSIHQLFRRIEVMLDNIDGLSDTHSWWKNRKREKVALTLVEYYYDSRNGYHDPQAVIEKLVEKVSVIHHLIEAQEITPRHDYYHYMLREFFQVVSDIVEVLTASIEMSKSE